MNEKKGRLKYGEVYFSVVGNGLIERNVEIQSYRDECLYVSSNYFHTEEEAKEVLEEFRKIIQRSNDELCDFQWGLMKMRQGKRVTRKAYRIQKEYEYDFWQMINGEIVQYWLTPAHFYEEFKCDYISIEKNCDFFATDWEIYGG